MIAWLKRNNTLIAALIIIAGAALRVAFAGRFAFFIDELHAVNFTRGGLIQAMRLLPETPGTAPLDYALVNLLQRVSVSEFWMRLWFALFGVWSIYLTYRLGARWLGRTQGIIASGLLAFSTAHLYYSQSIRCYSLGILLMLLAVDAFDRLVNENQAHAGKRLAAFCFLAALNQFFALIPLGFLLLYGLLLTFASPPRMDDMQRVARAAWLMAAAAAMMMVLGLCFKLVLVPKSLGVFSAAESPVAVAAQSLRALAMFSSFNNWTLNVFVLVLAVAGLILLLERRPRLFGMFAAVMLLPVPLIIYQEIRLKSGVQLRHLIFMIPFYFLAASWGLTGLAGWLARFHVRCRGLRWIRTNQLPRETWLLILCAWLALALAGQAGVYLTGNYEQRGEPDFRPDWRTSAKALAGYTDENDILIAAGTGNGPWRYCLDFYLDQYSTPRKWLPFERIEELKNLPHPGRVRFVYFDLPVLYYRDFRRGTDRFEFKRINPFITVITPIKRVSSPADLARAAQDFTLLVTPPSDYGIYAVSWADLGVAARLSGNLDLATQYQKRAVAVARNSLLKLVFDEIRAREELGQTYFLRGNASAAYEEWTRAAALVPHRISRALLTQLDYHPERLSTRLALAAEAQGMRSQALEHANRALRYNPEYGPARSVRKRLEGSSPRRP